MLIGLWFVRPNAGRRSLRWRALLRALLLASEVTHEAAIERSTYRSPDHQVDGGFIVDILVVRNATRWLRLNG